MSVLGGPRTAGAVAVLAVAAGLSPVVDGGSWLRDVALATAVVAGLGAVVGRTRVPAPAAVGAQLAGLVVLLCVLYAPAQAVLGLLPGPAAWGRGVDLVAEGLAVVRQQSAPVPDAVGLRFLITSGAGVLAVLVDALAVRARRPALAGLPLLGVHCTALVFAPGGLGWGWFALAAAGYLLLLGADAPERVSRWGRLVNRRPAGDEAVRPGSRGRGAAGRTAAVASVALAVVAPVLVPGVTAGADVRGSGSGSSSGGAIDSVDPLLDLRADLGTRGDAVVLSYRTGVEEPQPLRIVTVDTFDGDTWRPTPAEDLEVADLDDGMPAAPGLDDATPRERARYVVTVGALRQQWLPLPYPAVRVDVDGDWRVDPSTLNVSGDDERTRSGQQYTAEFLQVQPTSEQLAAAPPAPADVVAAYGTVPEDLPEEITATAREVTAGASDDYGRAVALQEFFRSDGGFTYSLDAPEPRSASALADFLEDRSGYCVHYASAMAVMARSLGIPARVAVGFLPGREGTDSWRIGLQDAHAWPELYFSGAGWVRFEPTPGARTGAAPEWTVPVAAPSAVPSAQAGTTPEAAAPAAPAPRSDAAEEGGATGAAQDRAGLPWQLPVVLALVLGLAAAPLVSRSVVSRRRWSRATGPQRAEAAWQDLVEQLGDLGVGVPASATPRQVGRSLVATAPPEAVGRLVSAVEGSRYAGARAGAAQDDLPADVRSVVAAMAATRPRSATWRWRWWPTSGMAHLQRAASRPRGLRRR